MTHTAVTYWISAACQPGSSTCDFLSVSVCFFCVLNLLFSLCLFRLSSLSVVNIMYCVRVLLFGVYVFCVFFFIVCGVKCFGLYVTPHLETLLTDHVRTSETPCNHGRLHGLVKADNPNFFIKKCMLLSFCVGELQTANRPPSVLPERSRILLESYGSPGYVLEHDQPLVAVFLLLCRIPRVVMQGPGTGDLGRRPKPKGHGTREHLLVSRFTGQRPGQVSRS